MPAKAKTIERYLGSDYVVEASVGHIRDLPAKATEVPAVYKGESWANLGIDVDNDFKALYVVTERAKKQVAKLKKLLKSSNGLYLATDEDREASHRLASPRSTKSPSTRVPNGVLQSPKAIQDAVVPRELDHRLVGAQEARRKFDRLYGYKVSPVMWQKVKPGLSAGRVRASPTV